MNIIQCTWILLQVVICQCGDIKPQFYERNEEACRKHAKDPYFNINMVMGKPWRIYYTWNMKFGKKCFDTKFKNATKQTIERFFTYTADYMVEQPYWETAVLHVISTVESVTHELLLFADQGPAGRFLAVPYIISSDMKPMSRSVPLLKFLIKLIHNGKYLLVMDCHVGGASLATRLDDQPYRADIASVVATMDLNNGYYACTDEKHKDEQFSQ